jgi:hypothetical protein
MHSISLHLVLHAFATTLIRWELNFNKTKPNGPEEHWCLGMSKNSMALVLQRVPHRNVFGLCCAGDRACGWVIESFASQN